MNETWIATLADGTEHTIEWRTTPAQESLPEHERDEWQAFVDGGLYASHFTRSWAWGRRFVEICERLPGRDSCAPAVVIQWRRAGEPSLAQMRAALSAVESVILPCGIAGCQCDVSVARRLVRAALGRKAAIE
jgi:hypothetical protein